MTELDIKNKELATDADVNQCDVSYLLNNDERLKGTGRREKIVKKLKEKIELKHFSDIQKSS